MSDTRTAINQRNESSQELLLLVSENNLKRSCYLRSTKGERHSVRSNKAESGRERQSSSLKSQPANEHRQLR